MTKETIKRKPGRPKKHSEADFTDTRQALIRAGLAALTIKGYSSTGIDEILKAVQVPKGSFYHYFASKEAFGTELIEAYGQYFAKKLSRWFDDTHTSPLNRLLAFIADAKKGMQKFEYQRGCLIGNLGQEMVALPEGFRKQLIQVFNDWEAKTAHLLDEAKAAGEIAETTNTVQMAYFFWVGWEGAVLRAKLEQSGEPLDLFTQEFINLIKA